MSQQQDTLKAQVAALPLSPGVYQFLDKNGTVIYVGKAKSLRKRVSSYFVQNRDHYPKYILTMDDDPEEQYDGIRRINARDWLLGLTD